VDWFSVSQKFYVNSGNISATEGFCGAGNVRIRFHRNFNVMQELRAFRGDVSALRCFQVLVLMPGNCFGQKKDLFLLCSGSPGISRVGTGSTRCCRGSWDSCSRGVTDLLPPLPLPQHSIPTICSRNAAVPSESS